MGEGKDFKKTAGFSTFAILLLLTALTFYAIGSVVDNEFVNYDDPVYVTENAVVAKGITKAGLRWALTSIYEGNWFPITRISHMIDVSLYRLDPRGHHLNSLLIHLANTLLLFVILHSATHLIFASFLTAALFSVHPLHVEAVAWVAERKEVLSTFFGLLATGAYLRYVRKPGLRPYLAVTVLFAMSLASKPMWMTFPLLMLLFDFWPLERIRLGVFPEGRPWVTFKHSLMEKLPFLGLSLASGLLALYTQHDAGGLKSIEAFSFGERLANVLVSYIGYLGKTVWPAGLAVYYPLQAGHLPWWQPVGALLIMVAITIWSWRRFASRPYLAVGWLWYLISLVPVIGLVQIGTQARADRYTYMPLIGIFWAAAWWFADLTTVKKNRSFFRVLISLSIIPLLVVCARAQVEHWKNSVTLFEQALAVTPANPVGLINLGDAYHDAGHLGKAEALYLKALALQPKSALAMFNLGTVRQDLGDTQGAIEFYEQTLALWPRHSAAAANLAGLLACRGKVKEAISWYRKVLEVKPDSADAHGNLGTVLTATRDLAQAADHFERAVALAPDDPLIRCNYAILLNRQGKNEAAAVHLAEAIRIRPNDIYPYCLMAGFMRQQGKFRQAERFDALARRMIDPQGCPSAQVP